jgi:hypothetical protein
MRIGEVLRLGIAPLCLFGACTDAAPNTPDGSTDEAPQDDDVDRRDSDDDDDDDAAFRSPVAVVIDGVAIEDAQLEFGSTSSDAPLDRTVLLRPLEPRSVEIFSQPPILLAGRDAESWELLTQPPATLPGDGASFTVRFAPHRGGDLEGALVVAFGQRSDERMILSMRGVGAGPLREPGLRTDIYDDSFDALPNFDSLTPTTTFQSESIDISSRAGTEFFAFRFTGHIEIPSSGQWTFSTTSDDGSRLIIDGDVVVNNDGLHGPYTVEGRRELSDGLHEIEVQFFEKTGGELLTVTWAGPGVEAASIPASALSSERSPTP